MRALICIVSVAGGAVLTAGAVQAQTDRHRPDLAAIGAGAEDTPGPCSSDDQQ